MIELHTWNTPNGRKISVALEEMELPYRVHTVDISKDEQFNPAFLAISPNNKIPAIIDPEGPDGKPISVFESGAILIYLAEKTGRFLPRDKRERVAVLEWLMWQMGGFGPMPGQVHHFLQVEGPGGPALRAGAVQQGNAPPLRRAGPSPGWTSLRGDHGGALDRRLRHPRLGMAARAASGGPRRLPRSPPLVRGDDGASRHPPRFRGGARLTRPRRGLLSRLGRLPARPASLEGTAL